MAQKLTLSAYLVQRGTKAKALTKGEAALLGIPYPLQHGWPRKYGSMEINAALLEQLAAHVETARQAVEEKARRSQAEARAAAASTRSQLPLLSTPAKTPVSPVPGFALRKARRYRPRGAAPWS